MTFGAWRKKERKIEKGEEMLINFLGGSFGGRKWRRDLLFLSLKTVLFTSFAFSFHFLQNQVALLMMIW